MAAKWKGGKKYEAFMRSARRAEALSKRTDVGFFSTAQYPDGTPVAFVAAIQEFGSWNIPERSFFRNAIKGADKDIMPVIREGIDPTRMVYDEKTAALVGEVMKARIQNSIRTLRDPPNAPVTIQGGPVRTKSGKVIMVKGKGSSNPLIDTGVMIGAVNYSVED